MSRFMEMYQGFIVVYSCAYLQVRVNEDTNSSLQLLRITPAAKPDDMLRDSRIQYRVPADGWLWDMMQGNERTNNSWAKQAPTI
jgi:hypothetical protein